MKKIKTFGEFINEMELTSDTNSDKFLKPLLKPLEDAINGDWEYKIYTINYHNEKTKDWAQITLMDDPATKVKVLKGNLDWDPRAMRSSEKEFLIEDLDDIIKYIKE